MTGRTYEEGLRDGQIQAIEETIGGHNDRLNHHSGRLRTIERVIYIGLGGLYALQALPHLGPAINAITGK